MRLGSTLTIRTLLKPGGLFMIYNLGPEGFTVVAFHVYDTEPAREMAKRLGWDEQMNLETDLFGTYTLAVAR